ncbi:hypothetical protein D0Y60_15055 [Shinella sp. WSJ-2]|nr:hypothetical protein D0Y60_15055 [Shinella sp. WSJ-2]
MPTSCPISTSEERRFIEIQEDAERAMLDKVYAAIADAAAEVATKLQDARLPFKPTHADYFTATVQQATFVRLCGGDPETLRGGDPAIGERIVQNGQNIIDHYWRVKIA